MAYQLSTGIATNEALINAICTFAAANGWTVDRNNLVGSSRTATLHKDSVTDYVHLFNTNTSEVRTRVSVGYSSGALPSAQPNVSPADQVSNNLVGPYPSVWFFANDDEIDIVIRRSDTAGAYSHIAFGRIQKYGTFDGGTYADGTNFAVTGTNAGQWDSNSDHALFGQGDTSPGYIRVDADSLTNRFLPFRNSSTAGAVAKVITGVGPGFNLYSANQAYSTNLESALINSADDNSFSGRSVFQVIEMSAQRVGDPTYYSPIGYVANRRYASLAKFDPEQEVTIAGDTWVVFPVVRKAGYSSVNNAPNASANNGFAIKKVA